jgi:NAD(P)-dependent dehydrogenase (short-subunit alcohol dehydrogenase family)
MGGTSGIGEATADLLAGTGAQVIVTGRDEGRLTFARRRGHEAHRVDGTDRHQMSAFFADLGPFDHLVLAFSPGPVGLGAIKDTPTEQIRTAIEGKLLAYLDAIRAAQVTGSITLIGASTARLALPGTVGLAAANGAIERVVSPLAAELAPVRVNAISPGFIDTPWWSFLSDADRDAQFAQAAEQVPVGRVGTADDVARAVAYLIEASFVTATVMAVDGGATVA